MSDRADRLGGHITSAFMVRMPTEMRAQLKEDAKKNGRSLNSEIVQRLKACISVMESIPMLEQREYTPFVLRVPESLHAALIALAASEKRSMNSQIVHFLEQSGATPRSGHGGGA